MVIAEGPRFPSLAKNFFEAGKAPAMRAVVDYLRALNEDRVLRIPDPDLAARQFLGLVNEPLLWLRVIGIGEPPPKVERTRVVDAAVAVFLDHYQPRVKSSGRRLE
jgi:hypothetical protein